MLFHRIGFLAQLKVRVIGSPLDKPQGNTAKAVGEGQCSVLANRFHITYSLQKCSFTVVKIYVRLLVKILNMYYYLDSWRLTLTLLWCFSGTYLKVHCDVFFLGISIIFLLVANFTTYFKQTRNVAKST